MLKRIDVSESVDIPFTWIDPTPDGSNLGRAEFEIEVFWKNGKVHAFNVYPRQQRDQKFYWHYKGGGDDFSISSYERLEDAKVWLVVWCKKHKAPVLQLYVPENSKILHLDCHGVSFLIDPWGKPWEPPA